MDIGSAKIRPEEMDGIPHHLIDVLEPEEEFNVVRFQELAKRAIREICSKGKIPILVGGTGFYIQAVLYDINFTENDGDMSYRASLEETARREGSEYLHGMLEKVDPEAAEQIHAHNVKKVIRALEFYHQTGQKISEHNAREREKTSIYNSAYFVLTQDRSVLYEKIDRRVNQMMEAGLLDEVRALKGRGLDKNCVSMQGLGYKEILAYLDGEYSLDEAVRIIKRDTRHFAKRQLTWFRREKDVIWIDKTGSVSAEEIVERQILPVLHKRNITGSFSGTQKDVS